MQVISASHSAATARRFVGPIMFTPRLLLAGADSAHARGQLRDLQLRADTRASVVQSAPVTAC